MSAFARAARNINYDLGLNKITEALQKRDQEKKRQEAFRQIGEAYKQWEGGQQNATSEQLLPGGKVTNPFAPSPSMGIGGTPGQIIREGTTPLPSNVLEGISIPERQTTMTPQKEKYEKAKANLNQFKNSMAEIVSNPNVDQNALSRLNVLGSLAEQQVEALKPKEKDVGTFNPEYDVVDKNTGNIIRKGTPKKTQKKTDSIYERVETFNVGGTPVKKGLRKDTGKWENLGEAYYKPSAAELKKDEFPDISTELGKTREGIQKIRDLKKAEFIDEVGADGQRIKGYKVKGSDIGMTGKDAANLLTVDQNELNMMRDKLKQKYVAPTLEAIKKRDLQDAVDVIRQQADSKNLKSVDKISNVIDKFIQKNPDYEEEKELLLAYFELFLL
jgi:hypothetical protein